MCFFLIHHKNSSVIKQICNWYFIDSIRLVLSPIKFIVFFNFYQNFISSTKFICIVVYPWFINGLNFCLFCLNVYFIFSGKQRWTASDRANNAITTQYNAFLQNLGVSSTGYEHVYFIAPGKLQIYWVNTKSFLIEKFLPF